MAFMKPGITISLVEQAATWPYDLLIVAMSFRMVGLLKGTARTAETLILSKGIGWLIQGPSPPSYQL
jgi:hypothetical protein